MTTTSILLFREPDFDYGIEYFDFNPRNSRCQDVRVEFFKSIAFGSIIGSCSFFSTGDCAGSPTGKFTKTTNNVEDLMYKGPVYSVSCTVKGESDTLQLSSSEPPSLPPFGFVLAAPELVLIFYGD